MYVAIRVSDNESDDRKVVSVETLAAAPQAWDDLYEGSVEIMAFPTMREADKWLKGA